MTNDVFPLDFVLFLAAIESDADVIFRLLHLKLASGGRNAV